MSSCSNNNVLIMFTVFLAFACVDFERKFCIALHHSKILFRRYSIIRSWPSIRRDNTNLQATIMNFPDWATPGELRKLYSEARTLGADDFTLSDVDAVEGFLKAKSGGGGPKKFFSYKNGNGEVKYFRGTEKDLDKFLDRNQLTLFDSEIDPKCDSNIAIFCDIESLSTSGGELQLLYPRYFIQQSDAKAMFDNANTKAQAWTDSLEVEAGDALAKFITPVSAGLLHKSHIYQVFAKHRLERTLRERDGVFLSVLDKAAFLVSVKARYGAEEEKDLLADIGGLQDKFVLSDWFFQTSEKKEKTLLQMPNYYPELKGVKELDFYGIAVSPLFDPRLPEHSRIVRLGRDISHNFPATAGGELGSLIAAKIASKLANKFC